MTIRKRWRCEAGPTGCVDNRGMLTYSSAHRL